MAYVEGSHLSHSSAAVTREWSATERMLVEIWSEVLDLAAAKLSPTSDFTQLGADSLAVKRMMLRARDHFGVSPSLGMLFEAPTLEAFARRIEVMKVAAPGLAEAPQGQWEEGTV